MPRWDEQAEERLRVAAVELFLEHGYEKVTVSQIADRAGVTRRTFSRYFADKRDVLFAGSDRLPGLLGEAVLRAEPELTPFEALVTALTSVGATLGNHVAPHAAERRKIVDRSPELQERGRTKFAAVADALAAALRQRGMRSSDAKLLADVGVALFRSGLARWADDPDRLDLAACMADAGADLHGTVTAQPGSVSLTVALTDDR